MSNVAKEIVGDRYVYLEVSDLHFTYNNKVNRYDYKAEVMEVINDLKSLITIYNEKGFKVILIFMGDLVDRSYKDLMEGIKFNNVMMELRLMCYKIYSVIGNHELSFYVDNPFWSLMKEVYSDTIKRVTNKTWQPRGVMDIVIVTDILEHGDTEFLFNHHGCGVIEPNPDKHTVGLFHQDICCESVIREAEKKFGDRFISHNMVPVDKYIPDGYNECYFAHMHKAFGDYTYTNDLTGKSMRLVFLSALGRPNQTEVRDDFLEKYIPAIIINNDKYEKTVLHKIRLPKREDCVKEEVVKAQQESRANTKVNKDILNYNSNLDNPLDNIRAKFMTDVDAELLQTFEQYVESGSSDLERHAKDLFREVFMK